MDRLVIFDLDGTLLNTIADLGNAANHTLAELGLPQHTLDEYRLMVGNGMRKLIMRALPDDKAADDAFVDSTLARFLEYYAEHIDVYTTPYPGIPELISALSTGGYKLAVASNKIQAGAERLIAKFFPDIPFVAVMGNSPKYPLKPDAAVGPRPHHNGRRFRHRYPDRPQRRHPHHRSKLGLPSSPRTDIGQLHRRLN